jgi:membrane-associated phospholipid phosphatase
MSRYGRFMDNLVKETWRDVVALGSLLFFLVIAIFLLFIEPRSSFIIILGLFMVEAVGALVKVLFYKARPDRQKFTNMLEKIDSGSFPSIHAARTILVALSIYHLFISPLAWAFLALLVLLVGASRVNLKRHYIVDVIGGYVFGFLVWYLVRLLF